MTADASLPPADRTDEDRATRKARLTSPGGFGEVASADEHRRYVIPKPSLRRGRRWCWVPTAGVECRRRATHVGSANGLGMTEGCEWHMRQWAAGTGYFS